MANSLAKIHQVDLREIWKHEALDFTNWLAEPENLQLLSDEIGIEIVDPKTEQDVGSFSVDILAVEATSDKTIIIENQLETTNHGHLGQLLTYASGLEAHYIIWIFKEIREEHRRAIDWLNEITLEDFNFFGIKMELWKIGDSLPAPKFNVICSPNDWTKSVRIGTGRQELTDNNLLQLDFWKGFSTYLKEHPTPFKARNARGQHWYNLSIGSSNCHMSCVISVKENFIRTELYIPDDAELYSKLLSHKEEIEAECREKLDWQELPKAKASRVALRKDHIDIKRKENHDEAYEWLLHNGLKIRNAMKKFI